MRLLALTLSAWCMLVASGLAIHEHYAAGVVDLNNNGSADPGGKLRLYGNISATQPLVTAHLEARSGSQLYAGYHVLDDNSPEGFSFTSKYFGDPLAASLNADLQMRILAVAGPAGGRFSFWEAFDVETPLILVSNTPTVTFLTGQPTNSFQFAVTEKFPDDPEPGGHIHHRAWTVDRPGTYEITFQLVDLSGQHAASDQFVFRFIAVPEPAAASLMMLGVMGLGLVRQRR